MFKSSLLHHPEMISHRYDKELDFARLGGDLYQAPSDRGWPALPYTALAKRIR